MSQQLGNNSLAGWIAALIQTGYEKGPEFTTSTNSTVTVYQHKGEGKVCVCITIGDTGQWVALYPQCGFWNDKYHHMSMGEGTKWLEGDPATMQEQILKDVLNYSSVEEDQLEVPPDMQCPACGNTGAPGQGMLGYDDAGNGKIKVQCSCGHQWEHVNNGGCEEEKST